MTSLNIALIFNDNDAHDIAAYSQNLAPMIASDYIVGVNSIAHITVLQVEMDPDVIRDRMAHLKFSPINVTATRAYQNTGSGGLTWHGIEIELLPELSAVQMQMWDALGRPTVHNKLGDQYYPHITTGHGKAVDPLQAPDSQPLIKIYPCGWRWVELGQSAISPTEIRFDQGQTPNEDGQGFRNRVYPVHLAVGTSGPKFQMERILCDL